MNELKKWLEEIDSNFARLNELHALDSNGLTTWKCYQNVMDKIAEIEAVKGLIPSEYPEYPDIEADGIVFCGKCGQQK